MFITAGEMRTSAAPLVPAPAAGAAASAAGSTLTSVIPQIGHVPGSSRTTSGCIGQRYFGFVCLSACSAVVSSAAVRAGSLGCFEQAARTSASARMAAVRRVWMSSCVTCEIVDFVLRQRAVGGEAQVLGPGFERERRAITTSSNMARLERQPSSAALTDWSASGSRSVS